MAKVYDGVLTILAGSFVGLRVEHGRANHFFCSHCGVHTFHRRRAVPDHFEINACGHEDPVQRRHRDLDRRSDPERRMGRTARDRRAASVSR